jgi:hypothetical protein
MSLPQILRGGTLLTGLVILGEAVALLVGMHVSSERDNPWISVKNDVLLLADLLTGAGLIYLALTQETLSRSALFYSITALALLAHGYREWEYAANALNKFCLNAPLMIVNTVKLTGVFILMALTAIWRFTTAS